MDETRVFADGYHGVFQKQEEFLECLKSIGRNSFWERRNSKNLRLVAITSGSKVEEELKEKYADEGLDEDIITDTIINTGLLLKVRNQYYPVSSCAIKSILDRAGISGAGLRRVEKSVYARILNDCLKVAKYLDMEMCMEVGKLTIEIGNHLMEKWDVTEEDLYRLGMVNMSAKDSFYSDEMVGIIRKIAQTGLDEDAEKLLEEIEKEDGPDTELYIASNRKHLFGACCLLNRPLHAAAEGGRK